MTMTQLTVWFWQRVVSPHMAGLAAALAEQGHRVVYVAEQTMSKDRQRQGWSMPSLGNASLQLAPTAEQMSSLAASAPGDSVHICQGLRGNGLVAHAQRTLTLRRLRQWAVMETVNDTGWQGLPKRLAYTTLFRRRRDQLEGVLAIGHRTAGWAIARGMARDGTFPFAYFLPDHARPHSTTVREKTLLRLVFVGQFVERKRLELLLDAIRSIDAPAISLTVVGSGPLEEALRAKAQATLHDQLNWLGQLPMAEVPNIIAQADCLVLPSQHDGWGAVISEALMVGTPVICSDACGAAGVVEASGVGGVFSRGDLAGLTSLLLRAIALGRPSFEQRSQLANWARCLGAEAGATYLSEILTHRESGRPQPTPPWLANGLCDPMLFADHCPGKEILASRGSSAEKPGHIGVRS